MLGISLKVRANRGGEGEVGRKGGWGSGWDTRGAPEALPWVAEPVACPDPARSGGNDPWD